MRETEKRRSGRVSVSIPIQVMGTDLSGEDFTEKAETTNLSRYGAAIMIDRKLAPNQEMVVRNPAAKKEALCRVVGLIRGEAGRYVYRLTLLDRSENLWNIDIPSPLEMQEVANRPPLQCQTCRNQESIHLSKAELEEFQAKGTIALYCKRCRDTTNWKVPSSQSREKPEVALHPHGSSGGGDKAGLAPGVVGVGERPRTRNERRHPRIVTRIRGCIRRAGLRDEEVVTGDVSREGFSFKSPGDYGVGPKIEVAIPYTPGQTNIFVPARIVRSRAIPSQGLTEYGAVYTKGP